MRPKVGINLRGPGLRKSLGSGQLLKGLIQGSDDCHWSGGGQILFKNKLLVLKHVLK